MTRTALTLLLVGLLAACGSPTRLRPAPGMAEVPRAAEAEKPATPDELMRASAQARPSRRADLLVKSQERAEDPFDLPPGPQNGQ